MLEPPPLLDLAVQSPGDYVTATDALVQTESYFATHYSASCPSLPHSGHSGDMPALQFVTWNVRGLQTSLPAAHQLMAQQRPMTLVLTETHLSTKQASMSWVRSMHPDYEVHTSCVPQASPLGGALGPCQAKLQPRNKGGVLIAVRKDVMQHQHVSRHAVPIALRGYLHHVSIHSLSSHTLHVLACYCPPMSSPDWRSIQAGIFEYLANLQPRLRNSGSKLLLAGDMNATFHASHRSHGNSLTCDTSFRRLSTQCGLQTCFTADPVALPHTCRSGAWGQRCSSSRLDQFCTFPSASGLSLLSADVHNVMYDSLYESSDHFPVLLRLQDASSIIIQAPCGEASLADASKDGAIAAPEIAFASFPAAQLIDWSTQLSAKHCVEVQHTVSCIREASQTADPAQLPPITQMVLDILQSAVSLAKDHLPTRTCPSYTMVTAKKRRKSYMPRAIARQYACQLSIAKACRLACKFALACQRAMIAVQDCAHAQRFVTFVDPADGVLALAEACESYHDLFALLQQHRHAAQRLAKSFV